MSNMSYCRFQNTAKDLDECQDALEGLLDDYGPLSKEEVHAAKRLLYTCLNLIVLVAKSQCRNIQELDDDDCARFVDEANQSAQEDYDEQLAAEEREELAAADDRRDREEDR